MVLQLKAPVRDGTTHLVLSLLEPMQQPSLLAPGLNTASRGCSKAISSWKRVSPKHRLLPTMDVGCARRPTAT